MIIINNLVWLELDCFIILLRRIKKLYDDSGDASKWFFNSSPISFELQQNDTLGFNEGCLIFQCNFYGAEQNANAFPDLLKSLLIHKNEMVTLDSQYLKSSNRLTINKWTNGMGVVAALVPKFIHKT